MNCAALRTDLVQVRRSLIHGMGLFAAHAIPAGTTIGEYAGRNERFVEAGYIGHMTMRVDHLDGRTELRNARYGGNALRYINHQAHANLAARGFCFYTLRDVAAGEELTFDYGHGWP